jgi:hypothetical protein
MLRSEPAPDSQSFKAVRRRKPFYRSTSDTGDLSAVLPGMSPCGRTNMRIRGWLGRVDQTTKVKGLFVTPRRLPASADSTSNWGGCGSSSDVRASKTRLYSRPSVRQPRQDRKTHSE